MLRNHPKSPSPFYKDDIDIPGIYPDRIRSEMEKPAVEVWKNLEDERVKNLFLNSRGQGSGSSFVPNNFQPVQPDSQTEIHEEIKPAPAAGSTNQPG